MLQNYVALILAVSMAFASPASYLAAVFTPPAAESERESGSETEDGTEEDNDLLPRDSSVDLAEDLSGKVKAKTRLIVPDGSKAVKQMFKKEAEIESAGGAYVLTFDDKASAKAAKERLEEAGFAAEYDATLTMPDDERLDPENKEDAEVIESVDTEGTDSIETMAEDVLGADEDSDEVLVAVIDTSVDETDEILAGRLRLMREAEDGKAEETEIIADDAEPTDDATPVEDVASEDADDTTILHGTLMAEIIASQTDGDVRILPIAAFDENGNGTVASVYFAIRSAIAQKADIINLSISGAGESKLLKIAINDARKAGITVVAAAGNDGADAKDYMPGNIKNAVTISATDTDEDGNIVIAPYSNTGNRIDFSADGTVIKDNGTEDTDDDEIYMGTSIAAANATAGIAFLYSSYNTLTGETDKLEPEELSAKIYDNIRFSAEDLGEEGYDKQFGYGYICPQKMQFTMADVLDDILEPADENVPELGQGEEIIDDLSDDLSDGEEKTLLEEEGDKLLTTQSAATVSAPTSNEWTSEYRGYYSSSWEYEGSNYRRKYKYGRQNSTGTTVRNGYYTVLSRETVTKSLGSTADWNEWVRLTYTDRVVSYTYDYQRYESYPCNCTRYGCSTCWHDVVK